MKHSLLAALYCSCSLLCFAQAFSPKNYPRDYFRDPLNIPISLAANFGELRPQHYHMGLDIRTQKKVNLPVFAAADGYIAKVKIEPEGFGQAIYINHPNGYTTLYAHLNQFFPALATYIQQEQYKKESWEVFITIPPGLFPVKKGELIAYSGSTGGSQGPHLHFEIRRTADDTNLNPLLFGLPVPDSTPPVILRLAVYDRCKSVYEQSPRILPVHRTLAADDIAATLSPREASYSIIPALITVASPKTSFAISAFDTQSGSSNPNGIYQAILYEDGQPLVGFQLDNINYTHTRNINAHIDYKTRETGGPFLQQVSELPGYTPPSIYRRFASDGVIDLRDGLPHDLKIEVKDAYGNSSGLEYRVQYKKDEDQRLQRMSPPPPGEAGAGKKFYPGMLDGYETKDCAFYIGENGLYDSVQIDYSKSAYAGSGISQPGAISAVHDIGEPYIPLQDSLLVRIRSERQLEPAEKDRVVMLRFAGDKKDVQKVQWQGEWASARFRDFGHFQLVEDEQAPVIIPGFRNGARLGHSTRIVFRVKDNLGTIRDFRAELDGKWLCFTNDKGLAFIYTFDRHCPPGNHRLLVTVRDEAGNTARKVFTFTN